MHERSKRTNKGNAKSHQGMAMQAKPEKMDVTNTIQKVEQHSDELPRALPTTALDRAMVGFPEDTEDCEMCAADLLSTAQQVHAPFDLIIVVVIRLAHHAPACREHGHFIRRDLHVPMRVLAECRRASCVRHEPIRAQRCPTSPRGSAAH
jgi:hypothetical protein